MLNLFQRLFGRPVKFELQDIKRVGVSTILSKRPSEVYASLRTRRPMYVKSRWMAA